MTKTQNRFRPTRNLIQNASATVLVLCSLALPACAAADPVTMSFVFVGCNRVGWGAKDGVPLPPSTANTPQLLQTFEDIKTLETTRGRAPEYLFLVGDLVRNETSARTLKSQLALWQGLWDNGALAGSKTTLVPVTGNHEVLDSVEYADGSFYEVPNSASNGAWVGWINANNHPPQPGNGPTPTNSPGDLLKGDNSQLTYSFDAKTSAGKTVHFVVMNTDTDSSYGTTDTSCYQPTTTPVTYNGHPVAGTTSQAVPGWIALDWIQQDLAAANADLTFAFGHKPLVYPSTAQPSDPSTGRDTLFNCADQMLAQDLYTSFKGSESFVAYLVAHKHLWDAFEINGDLWQIVAGDAGSNLEQGDQFGFTLIEIHQSGKVVATPYVRPVPTPYYSPNGVVPATAGTSFTIRAAGS